MNKQKPVSAAHAVLPALLVLLACLFGFQLLAAGETDLYHESLKFDSNGNLLMTTRDKKAGSSTRYQTIGWTMKRMPDVSGSTVHIFLKLGQNGESGIDPSDPNYIFTYFKCDKERIFTKIGEASPDWQRDLYQNGGTVYLDAIMTIVENGTPLGYMDENGTLHGEVYTTADGIIHARAWADAQALLTHFNKALCFPPIPDMLDGGFGTDKENRVRISYGLEECEHYNTLLVQAAPEKTPQFDVEKGVPTGEKVFAKGQLQKYYYDGMLIHHYGTVSVPVEITVRYTYTEQTEKGPVKKSFSNLVTYYVSRPYSYYRIESLQLFTLDRAMVNNKALPVVPLVCQNLYKAQATIVQNRECYMEIDTYKTSVHGGDLSEGTVISGEQLEEIANKTAGDVRVRNDVFIIDDETILDGSYADAQAPEPKKQHGGRLQSFRSADLTISHSRANDRYDTVATAVYRNRTGNERQQDVKHTNPVIVHTPVVCKGGITDDIAHNQQVMPTAYFSLVLGRSFSVGISTVGTHKDQKGYGTRDYEKYTAQRQIRFPFEVYDGAVRFAEDTWIDLPEEQKTFYLPVGIHEGDYRIRYRTIAKNAAAKRGGADENGYLANLELSEYAAYDELDVTVIGRMYDLAVTDIVDYPRWRSVFYEADGSEKRYAFWIGKKNLEGDAFVARASDGIIPILPGDHPFNRSARAVGLGYRVKLQLKTIGDMRGTKDRVVLHPTYYYLSRDGSRRQQVRLYQKKDLSEVYVPLVMTAADRSYLPVEKRNVSDPELRAQSVQLWDGEYQLSPDLRLVDAGIDLDSYIRQHGGRIGQRDPVFLRDGYLLVQFEVRTYPADSPKTGHLSYANTENSAAGYCNMWRLQGFSYDRTDCFGNHFMFEDGDCMLFDTKYSLHSDYESWGTH